MLPPGWRLIFGGAGEGGHWGAGGGSGTDGAVWEAPALPPGFGGGGAGTPGATGGAGAEGGGRILSSGGRLIWASAVEMRPGTAKGPRTERKNTKLATQRAATPWGAGESLIVTMDGYTTRRRPQISSL